VTEELSAKLRKAGRNRVVVSHGVGAAHDGRHALIKVALFGRPIELYALPAGLAYWLIDRVAEAMEASAIKDRRSDAGAGSPEARQVALHAAVTDGIQALLILPDQVAILLQESLTLAATYLIDRTHPPLSHSEH
jgi:hypothetical protein